MTSHRGGRRGEEPVAAEQPDPEEADEERGADTRGPARRHRDQGKKREGGEAVRATATEGEGVTV